MLVLPVDEDSWVFGACLCVGMALLVLDVVLPRIFRRHVRLVPLACLLRLPRPQPIPDEHFRRIKRDLERQIRAFERDASASAAESARARPKKARAKKVKTRVVMLGDRSDTDKNCEPTRTQQPRKRVSFDMPHHDLGESPRKNLAVHVESLSRSQEAQPTSFPPVCIDNRDQETTAHKTHDPVGPITSSASPTVKPHVRPDPFSLVDDDFPWQLPNYARPVPHYLSQVDAPKTSQAPQKGQEGPARMANHEIPLNIRNPAGHATALKSKVRLELKQKPIWRRSPAKQGAALSANFPVLNTRTSSVNEPSNLRIGGKFPTNIATSQALRDAEERSGQQSHPDPSLYPSSLPADSESANNPYILKKRIIPSPKPPLHTHQILGTHATTSLLSTPTAVQTKLRTPKIIRRITFDEDMMGALATPSDVSPLITESTRKRQRQNDVQEALEAMGLPWHKRRLHNR